MTACDTRPHLFHEVWTYPSKVKHMNTSGGNEMFKGLFTSIALITAGMLGLPVAILAML